MKTSCAITQVLDFIKTHKREWPLVKSTKWVKIESLTKQRPLLEFQSKNRAFQAKPRSKKSKNRQPNVVKSEKRRSKARCINYHDSPVPGLNRGVLIFDRQLEQLKMKQSTLL
uniref:Uncharacterized protein n=1 Tax=Rhizophora mucronata TaxID=61149 RepID=A0A2P2L841_RHIMU